MDYSALLPFCTNDSQTETVNAVLTTGSQRKAAKYLGIDRGTVNARIKRITKQAEYQGLLGEHKDQGTVPAGFYAETSVKRRLNEETGQMDVVEDWTKSKLAKGLEQEHFERLIQGLNAYTKPAKPQKPNLKKYSKNLANAIVIGDAHIGMLAHAVETNDEDYNLGTAIADLHAGIDYLVDCSPASEQGWFINVGDFTHADGTANTTTNGTKQDVAARQFETMEAAGKLMRYAVDKMLTKFKKVIVINARGNHDNDTAFALNMFLQGIYEKEPRVEVQGNRAKFNYIEFGKCLIGVNHGDKINTSRLVGTMTKMQAEAWGRTTFRRWWIGHIHHKTKQETDFGCMVESFNTLVPLESWHAACGYGAERRITMITLHKEFGEVSRLEPSIEMIRAMST
jgi:hypothetical protein